MRTHLLIPISWHCPAVLGGSNILLLILIIIILTTFFFILVSKTPQICHATRRHKCFTISNRPRPSRRWWRTCRSCRASVPPPFVGQSPPWCSRHRSSLRIGRVGKPRQMAIGELWWTMVNYGELGTPQKWRYWLFLAVVGWMFMIYQKKIGQFDSCPMACNFTETQTERILKSIGIEIISQLKSHQPGSAKDPMGSQKRSGSQAPISWRKHRNIWWVDQNTQSLKCGCMSSWMLNTEKGDCRKVRNLEDM